MPETSKRARGTAAVIGWTALSAVLPGSAHLRAGRRRTGFALLGTYVLAVAALAFAAFTANAELAGRLLDPAWLRGITIAAVVAALGWFALLVRSYVILRPGELSQTGQIISGILAGALAVTVTLPFAVVAQYVMVSEETLNTVFDSPATVVAAPTGAARPESPWAGRTRVNILLLGGDWQPDRVGVRTDSVNLASVDVRTGDTVLLSLPRNLENVRFPPGSPMHERFPAGFRLPANPDGSREDLLFAVWEYAETHTELFGGRTGMGPETLKETVGYTLGVEVDWYALVNMWGLARIIDALGGLTLTVPNDIVFGKHNEGLVRAGTRKLRGADAMWFARSRTFSDDYTRMGRQRCVLDALLHQADPGTVLLRFNQLAKASKGMFRTDIPRKMLEHLVPLAVKVRDAQVTGVPFVPPLINTGNPDWARIRKLSAKAIRASAARAASPSPAATASGLIPGTTTPATATPENSAATATPEDSAAASASPENSASASPTGTGTPSPSTSAGTPSKRDSTAAGSDICGT
ncbi:LCP family protein [Sphaerisporangium corydalis]|uniref:LCP family protein n=1 Tax=Sphaerisporangium corydalis TaxID=1441875 RepID=A0ABV9EBA2_9ACTN|nr:LCP family protein [Sphaerisporangium corydalis]